MNDELRRLVGFGVAAALGLTALVLAVPRLLGAAAGPEVEILTALKTAESKGLELDVGLAQPLTGRGRGFQRISVTVESEARALVTATLDFDGKVGETEVSSLGAERVPFVDRGDWEPEAGFAPRLVAVVKALEQRRAALERGELSKLCSGRADGGESAELAEWLRVKGRKVRVSRWLIRSERDDVLVTEEWRLSGTLPERPVDVSGARRLLLQVFSGGEFCFPEGLM